MRTNRTGGLITGGRSADPTWFGLLDFKVLLLEKPGGAPKTSFTEEKGYQWYSQKQGKAVVARQFPVLAEYPYRSVFGQKN